MSYISSGVDPGATKPLIKDIYVFFLGAVFVGAFEGGFLGQAGSTAACQDKAQTAKGKFRYLLYILNLFHFYFDTSFSEKSAFSV